MVKPWCGCRGINAGSNTVLSTTGEMDSPQGVTEIFQQDAVVTGYLARHVADKRNLQLPQPTLIPRSLGPAKRPPKSISGSHGSPCTHGHPKPTHLPDWSHQQPPAALCGQCAGTHQATWVNSESTEAPITAVLRAANSSARSLNARISVGHTKVKSRG